MLARQVREVGVAVEVLRGLLDDLGAVEQLERVDPLHGRARDVAHRVAAAAGGRDARGVEVREDLGQTLQCQVVELDVLTCRELADAPAEAVGDLADRAQLGRLDEPGGQLHAQHERADLRLVVVEPPPLEADDVLLGNRFVARGDQRRQLVADAQRRLVALDALDGIALEDEVPIGLGSLAFRTDSRAHGYLLTACSGRPCGYALYARCRSPCRLRDARASPNDETPGVVSGARKFVPQRALQPAGSPLAGHCPGAGAGTETGARDDSSQRSTSSEPPGSPGLAPCPGGRLPRRHRAGTLNLS